jgi:hypothetical protein
MVASTPTWSVDSDPLPERVRGDPGCFPPCVAPNDEMGRAAFTGLRVLWMIVPITVQAWPSSTVAPSGSWMSKFAEGQVDLQGHDRAVKRAARQSIRAFPNIDRIVILDGTVH